MRSVAHHRRLVVTLGTIASMLIGGLVLGDRLLAPAVATAPPPPATRPVTAAEATRLAAVRLTNYRTGHAGVHIAIGSGATAVHLDGWIDWRTPLIYLNRVTAGDNPADGLLQAIPGVVATHAGRYTPPASAGPVDPFPAPPVPAPPTGWRVGPTDPAPAVDTVLTLLFTLRAGSVDDAGRIATLGTRFVGTDEIDGTPVDVLDGAALLPARPAGPTSPAPEPSAGEPAFATEGGQVRYWIDAGSHLLRAEALIDTSTLLRIDIDPTDPTVPTAIELLGGARTDPATPTPAEIGVLARMRERDYAAGGGLVTLAVPAGPGRLYSARGYLDWRAGVIYLTIRANDAGLPDRLWRADTQGVASLAGPPTPPGTGPPPVPLPTLRPPNAGWRTATWAARTGTAGLSDLDTLVRILLLQASGSTASRTGLARAATRLRTDTVDGVPVVVYEIRGRSEADVPAGQGRLRYWVDAQGRLRRLELRTHTGAWAYATVSPGAIPALPDLVPAP